MGEAVSAWQDEGTRWQIQTETIERAAKPKHVKGCCSKKRATAFHGCQSKYHVVETWILSRRIRNIV